MIQLKHKLPFLKKAKNNQTEENKKSKASKEEKKQHIVMHPVVGQNNVSQNAFKNLMWDAVAPEFLQVAAGMLAESHTLSMKQ